MLTWDGLAEPLDQVDSGRLTALLLAASEAERLAFAGEVETRIRAESGDWWSRPFNPAGCYALIVIACMPTAGRAAALLTRRGMRWWHLIAVDSFLEIARARQLPWLGDLGARLARVPRVDEMGTAAWLFLVALLEEDGTPPPVAEGFVRGWLDVVNDGPPAERTDRLRTMPFLDEMLPAVFDIDGIGALLTVGGWDGEKWDTAPRFPAAVAALVAEGRLHRDKILDATVERLVRGDRPGALRAFVLLHDALAPTPEEMAPHTSGYARLLAGAPSSVAGPAQRALRALDAAGMLELATLLEVSGSVLMRPEKGLVKAQLIWLERAARHSPERAGEILETVAVAFGHPALDLQERALAVVGRFAPGPELAARLLPSAELLPGDLRARAIHLLGGAGPGFAAPASPASASLALTSAPALASPALASPASTAAAGPDPMPAPIVTAAELAEEIVALLHEETAVRWERVLAGLVTVDGPDPTGSLGRRLSQARGPAALLAAAVGGEQPPHVRARMVAAVRAAWTDTGDGMDRSLIDLPDDLLALRAAELCVQIDRSPVPELLATPTRMDGSIDASVLVDRLARLEADGWPPWPLDFEQALLRVRIPGEPPPGAAALASPHGRWLAGWLTGGGLPEPVSTRVEQASRDAEGRTVARRAMVNVTPAGTGGRRLLVEKALFTIARGPRPRYDDQYGPRHPDILAMTLPHHREVVAAWALPRLAGLADQDLRDASLLPLLADAGGAAGPAMALAVAYGLGARHQADRVAAVDAFLTLTAGAGAGAFASRLGAELGDLCTDGTIKLNRVVPALTDAHQAGASGAVWQVAEAALPPLLAAAPRALPDLLELATRVAGATGAHGEIPGLSAAAGRTGGSRLVREARRLHATLTRAATDRPLARR